MAKTKHVPGKCDFQEGVCQTCGIEAKRPRGLVQLRIRSTDTKKSHTEVDHNQVHYKENKSVGNSSK